jgi:hypothetical protein
VLKKFAMCDKAARERPYGSGFHVAVAQVADDVLRGPVGAPGRGGPVAGTESLQNRDESLPLLLEHVEQVLWIEVAGALGAQQQDHVLPSCMDRP